MPDLRSGGRAERKETAKVRNNPAEEKSQAPNLNPNSRRRVGTATREETAPVLAQPDARENQIGLEEGVGDNNGVELAIAEKKMDEFDSGAKSGENRLGGEDEGSTAPLPETVSAFCYFSLIYLSNDNFMEGGMNKQNLCLFNIYLFSMATTTGNEMLLKWLLFFRLHSAFSHIN
jgi:hypothetical protein